MKRLLLLPLALPLVACRSMDIPHEAPIPGAERVDHLIEDDEHHFAALWKLTSGGENAEGYWSFAGDRLSLQRRNPAEGVDCDRIYTTTLDTGELVQLSGGGGVTTCAHFLLGDEEVVFGSTHGMMEGCPPPPDRSKGYVWMLYPEYDIWARPVDWVDELNGIDDEVWPERRLTDTWGYDAEATVSQVDGRIVFTSTRSGDIELWTMNPDGSDQVQVTDTLGYDGGAFFSHDGRTLVFRTTEFPADPAEREAAIEDYQRLLAEDYVRPSAMEIYTIGADGSDRTQVTKLGGANFAPYFYPDDSRIVFSSNFASPTGREFDLFAIDTDGTRVEQITTYEGFDSFPMFSRDGKWFVFSSNRGGTEEGETNLFVAYWKDHEPEAYLDEVTEEAVEDPDLVEDAVFGGSELDAEARGRLEGLGHVGEG